MKHTNVYQKLVALYQTYNSFIEFNRLFDPRYHSLEIFTMTITSLYYFVFNNPSNRELVLKLMN